MAHIDFYLEFASPYAFLASHWIDDLAAKHNATVTWRPFLLGAVFKKEGNKPLTEYPNKGAYSLHDMERSAKHQGVPFTMPKPFPFLAVAACRGFYALVDEQPQKAKELAQAIFKETFTGGKGVATLEQVLQVAEPLGIDTSKLDEAMQSPEIKQRLMDETETAITTNKVFGAPFFLINGEPFWGNDKRAVMNDWLTKGGW